MTCQEVSNTYLPAAARIAEWVVNAETGRPSEAWSSYESCNSNSGHIEGARWVARSSDDRAASVAHAQSVLVVSLGHLYAPARSASNTRLATTRTQSSLQWPRTDGQTSARVWLRSTARSSSTPTRNKWAAEPHRHAAGYLRRGGIFENSSTMKASRSPRASDRARLAWMVASRGSRGHLTACGQLPHQVEPNPTE